MTDRTPAFEADTDLEIERLQLALEAAQVGTWDFNLVTGNAQWSAICKQLFGLSPDVTVTPDTLLAQVHPDDQERVRQANARILSPQSDGEHNVIFRTLAHPSHYRWVQAKGRTIVNQQGKIVRFNGIVIDITELKLAQEAQRLSAEILEQRVAERTQALKEANQHLKKSNDSLAEFAYIASHDLQEPLRKILTFGDVLKANYATELGEGIDFLERMQTSAQRMSTLIKDLLTFSRVSTRQRVGVPVDLGVLVKDVLMDLELTVQDTGAEIEVAALPTVQGDPSQLTQLLQNLVSNALKFHRAEARPVVNIQAELVQATELPPGVTPGRPAAMYHRLDIQDNGIGFDVKYLDRIFQVFQRLHRRDQYVGTGIGLAICEKVVANHGGFITATSQLNQGATFSVYLPL